MRSNDKKDFWRLSAEEQKNEWIKSSWYKAEDKEWIDKEYVHICLFHTGYLCLVVVSIGVARVCGLKEVENNVSCKL